MRVSSGFVLCLCMVLACAGCGSGGAADAGADPGVQPDAAVTSDDSVPTDPGQTPDIADEVTPDLGEAPDAEPDGSSPVCLLAPQASPPDPDAPVALFRLTAPGPSTPFPFDLYTRAGDTPSGRALDVGPDVVTPVSAAVEFMGALLDAGAVLGRIDGFSIFGAIVFPFTAELDPGVAVASPPDAAPGPAFLVPLDKATGTCGAPVPAFVDVEAVDAEGGVKGLVVLRPFLPLQAGQTYVAFVTRQLRGANDVPIEAHPHFRAAIGWTAVPDDLPADRATAASAALASLDGCLASLPVPLCAGDLAAATVFTTRDGTVSLRSARDRMLADEQLGVTLERDGDGDVILYAPADLPSAVPDQDLSASSVAIRGAFDVPDFRTDGDVQMAVDGMPPATRMMQVPFVLLLPADDPAIPRPFRVVVMAHGHGGNKERVAHLARRFGEQGLALAAIDAHGHGELSGDGGFLNPDLRIARGSFIQSDVNLIRFLGVVQTLGDLDVLPVGAPDGVPDLDLSGGIGFIGESLGSLTGAPACALEPGVRAVVLNVGGGGLTNCAPDTVEPLLGSLDRWVYWGLKSLLQAVVDTFDPIAFADRLAADDGQGARAILMQSVVGDTAFDGPPTNDMARVLGLTSVCPCPRQVPFLPTDAVDFDGSGLFYYDNAAHGFLLADTSNPPASDAVRRQAAHFLRTALDGGTPRIRDFRDVP